MPSEVNKHVFQRRLAKGDGVNLGREGFHHIAHEGMAMRHLDPHAAVDDHRRTPKTLPYLALQTCRVRRLHYHDISAHTRLQLIRRADRDQASLMQDADAITVLGFLQDMGGQEHTHPFLVTQMLQIGHKIEAGAWIEASAGLIEQQQGRSVQERFGQLHTAL